MKRAIKIIFISVIGICVVAILAGYIALTQIDFNNYTKSIVKIVRDSTGRELTIGDIKVKASFNPTVELRDVTFSNAEWAKDPLMVKADAVDLGFAVVPLLRKHIVIDTFKLSNAVIDLEVNASGEANWEMNLPEVVPDIEKTSYFSLVNRAEAAENSAAEIPNLLSSLVVKHVALENVKVNYIDKSAPVQTYDLQYLDLDENINGNIDFKFDVNKGLYAGSGTLGALHLLNATNGYPVAADINVAGVRAVAQLMLFDLLGDMRFDGNVQVNGFLGKNSSYNEKADVSIKGGLKEINAILNELVIANNVIEGTASVNLTEKTPVIKAVLRTNKIDIASFVAKKTAINFSLIRSAHATTLVPSQLIPYDMLYKLNANADVSIALLTNGQKNLAKDLQVNAKVNNGKAVVNLSKGTISNGPVKATAELNAPNESVYINANVSKLNLLNLMQALDVDSAVFNFINGGDTDIHIKLNGKGKNYVDVVNSLDGQIITIIDKSEVHLGNIGIMKGNIISQLLNTLNVAKSNDDLNLRCAVARADLKNGNAVFPNGIVLNADQFTLVANGQINLNNDKIDLSIKPFAGKLTDTNIAKALSSLVKLTGTLQDPKIGVDGANAIKTIVGVTTTGPVYLGAQMLLENDGSPCYTALQGTGYETLFPKSENVVQSTTGDVGQILDDSVGAVKDTAKGLLNLLSGGGLEKSK